MCPHFLPLFSLILLKALSLSECRFTSLSSLVGQKFAQRPAKHTQNHALMHGRLRASAIRGCGKSFRGRF